MPAGVASLLSAARDELARLSPRDANDEMRSGAILVDIRSERQIAIDGAIPGAVHVPRNVLEWRLDPACEHRDPELARRDARGWC